VTRAFDDPHRAFYSVGQVAELLGVQAAFLRRLDAERLVRPARSDGGQRRYSRHDIGLIERVVALVEEGLTLAGIRRLLVLEDEVTDLKDKLAAERAAHRETRRRVT